MNMRPGFDYRNDFAAALVDRAADAHPSGMDACAARRFRVYRNNVHGALISALADAYPVVQRLVGEDFFAAMAREFFLLESTRETSLALYGKGFAAFIDEFEPAASVAYLGDIARLERARLEALHALDAPVLDSSALPTDGEQLLASRFVPHAATRLVVSRHPVVTIWLANQVDGSPAHISARSEIALITRPGFEVAVLSLDEAAGAFVQSLMSGATVQTAYATAAAITVDFDIGSVFLQLLEAGALTEHLN